MMRKTCILRSSRPQFTFCVIKEKKNPRIDDNSGTFGRTICYVFYAPYRRTVRLGLDNVVCDIIAGKASKFRHTRDDTGPTEAPACSEHSLQIRPRAETWTRQLTGWIARGRAHRLRYGFDQ